MPEEDLDDEQDHGKAAALRTWRQTFAEGHNRFVNPATGKTVNANMRFKAPQMRLITQLAASVCTTPADAIAGMTARAVEEGYGVPQAVATLNDGAGQRDAQAGDGVAALNVTAKPLWVVEELGESATAFVAPDKKFTARSIEEHFFGDPQNLPAERRVDHGWLKPAHNPRNMGKMFSSEKREKC